MTTLEKSVLINGPLEKIEAIALDAARLPDWYVGIQETHPDGKYPEPGGTIDAVYRAAGINFKMKMTSVELQRGQGQTIKMDGMITGSNRWRYGPEGSGTRVTATFDYEMPGGGVGQMLNKLVVEKMNAENLEKSLQNLKSLVESQ
jgi:uncharacterized membrane protein